MASASALWRCICIVESDECCQSILPLLINEAGISGCQIFERPSVGRVVTISSGRQQTPRPTVAAPCLENAAMSFAPRSPTSPRVLRHEVPLRRNRPRSIAITYEKGVPISSQVLVEPMSSRAAPDLRIALSTYVPRPSDVVSCGVFVRKALPLPRRCLARDRGKARCRVRGKHSLC